MTDNVKDDEVVDSGKDDVQVTNDEQRGEQKDTTPQSTDKLSPLEEQAVSFGWKPKAEWVKDGNTEEDWVPAKHFLKFGELKQQTIQKDKELQKQQKLFKLMKDHHSNVKEAAYKQAKAEIQAERKKALEQENFAAAEQLRDEMEALTEKYQKEKDVLPADVAKELSEKQEVTPPPVNPEFIDWHAKNPWYISDLRKQDEMSQEADLIGQAIVLNAQRKGKTITADEVYKGVEKEIKARYPDKFKAPKSPQEDSPTTTSGKSSKASVKLDEEQAAVAKAFGLTPEKYAEQLKTYEKGRKW